MAAWRMFIAVAVDDAIIARVSALQHALRQAAPRVAWVKPAGMHLTLKFLGDVPTEDVAALGAAVRAAVAPFAAFPLALAGTGAFPSWRRPRVVWAGVTEGATALAALAAAVDGAVTPLGFPPETRPFTPHLTLGRVKEPGGLDAMTALAQEHAADAFGAMTVREVILFRSELSPRGATYTAIARLPLAGTPPTG